MVIKNYFAAANGYSGFRSYFGEIFKSEDFKHIYVLKGGPGTGKSSLMNKIAKLALDRGIDHDKIFCSSDPSSLDGVIIHTERGDYAVIDGTAPHERDAVIPGAIDDLINIGENFDDKALVQERNEIINLNRKKKDSYQNAYTMLKAAGVIAQRINEILKKHFSYETAYELAESLLCGIDATLTQKPSVALISAFGKNGRQKIEAYQNYKRVSLLYGKHGEEKLFLNILYDKSRQNCSTISFDPLSEDVDGIAFGDVLFTVADEFHSAVIDVSAIIDGVSEEELYYLEGRRDSLLKDAEECFASASLSHFELEKIYSKAMLFEKNELLLNRIIKDIF